MRLRALDDLRLNVSAEADFEFQGAAVRRDGLFPKPTSIADAEEVLGGLLEIEAFAGCRRTSTGFLFVPEPAMLDRDDGP